MTTGKSTSPRGCFVTIGNFDGVHRGHRRMISVLRTQADRIGSPAVVVTFDPPPVAVLRPDRTPPSLTTAQRKQSLLAQCGIETVETLRTTPELLGLTPREFFDRIILGRFHAVGVVEGPNFCFGRDRSGDVDTLAEFCREADIAFHVVTPVEDETGLISSSRIRQAIARGHMIDAVDMLGHAYRLTGRVGHGAGRGRGLGFPTANLDSIETLLPADGVYAGLCEVGGQQWPVAVNVGRNPTFSEDQSKVEVHVIGWNGDLYDRKLDVDFIAEIRPVLEFKSADELKQQIHADVESARRLASTHEEAGNPDPSRSDRDG